MNIIQLRYIVEIEKTQSITKAAENLYMGQPNLSRSVRELEKELGFKIFRRTQKGTMPTSKGEELLMRAKKVLAQVDAIEQINNASKGQQQKLTVAAPRANYIATAFSKTIGTLNLAQPMQLNFKETNAIQAIACIENRTHNLGIVRYRTEHEPAFLAMLESKRLYHEEAAVFEAKVLLSKTHPLATKEDITAEDLAGYIKISYGDPYTPPPSHGEPGSASGGQTNKNLLVYDRAGALDILSTSAVTYMWSSPVSPALLKRFNLVLRPCPQQAAQFKDILIYRKTHKLSELDRLFINELCFARREFFAAVAE